jgi:undecaprenyl diphosphate synthase
VTRKGRDEVKPKSEMHEMLMRPSRLNSHMTASTSGQPSKLPRHVGIIMDGNSRFVTHREGGKSTCSIADDAGRFAGHVVGYRALKELVKSCVERRIEALTVFALSAENWGRSSEEVSFLLRLFESAIKQEREELVSSNVRVKFIGNRSRTTRLPKSLLREIDNAEASTLANKNNGMQLTIAIDYSARQDIVNATRLLAARVRDQEMDPQEIDEASIVSHLSTSHLPPLDLIIRTSGEQRLSNFLLWEAAYAELVFVEEFWPSFTDKHLDQVLLEYSRRKRKFGLRPAGQN